MNPHTHPAPGVDAGGQPPADAPTQVVPWAEDAPSTIGAADTQSRYSGALFLPGWLKTELNPTAEQGPGS